MQQQEKRMLEEPLKRSNTVERALDDLQESKKLAHEANVRHGEAMSTGKVSDIYTDQVNSLNQTFNKEMKMRDEDMVLSMKFELEKARRESLHKDAFVVKLKEKLDNTKSFESKALSLLAESEHRFQEMEIEIEERKESEKRMFDSLTLKTKELEQTKMALAESKLEIDSLQAKLKKLEAIGASEINGGLNDTEESFQSLKSELRLVKNELKLATEAEENSKMALDDLASALKEVATEANRTKEKLSSTEEELQHTKQEAEKFKSMLKSSDDKLDELKKEADIYKNTSERLRMEAEESLLAWSGKEIGFVDCIKRAEEERDAARQENCSLIESLKASEGAITTGKQENNKLRDILKQALNEANVAKEAARIAAAENSQLKDALREKQQALEFIIQDNQNLKMNEAAALDSIKELKILLHEEVTNKEPKFVDVDPVSQELQPRNFSSDYKEMSEGKKLLSEFGFNIRDLKIPHKIHNYADRDGGDDDSNDEYSDSAREDPLKGSIFDTDSPVAPPVSDSHYYHHHHHRRKSSLHTDGGGGDATSSDDFDSMDGAQFEDAEGDKNSRKKKALLRRFGDMLLRRNFYRKEPSLDSTL